MSLIKYLSYLYNLLKLYWFLIIEESKLNFSKNFNIHSLELNIKYNEFNNKYKSFRELKIESGDKYVLPIIILHLFTFNFVL